MIEMTLKLDDGEITLKHNQGELLYELTISRADGAGARAALRAYQLEQLARAFNAVLFK